MQPCRFELPYCKSKILERQKIRFRYFQQGQGGPALAGLLRSGRIALSELLHRGWR